MVVPVVDNAILINAKATIPLLMEDNSPPISVVVVNNLVNSTQINVLPSLRSLVSFF